MSELENFVLGYLEQVEGIVETAAYNVHEVLLPDEVAGRWRIPAYQQISFDEVSEPDVIRLGYNHSLVEQMVKEARSLFACTRYHINGLHLNKKGLDKLAGDWILPNSRVTPLRRATISRVRSTYIRFNVKAALVSDEKQERLVSVLMDAHTGCAAAEPDRIEQMANHLRPDQVLGSLSTAPMRWGGINGKSFTDPLAQETLAELLQRAQTAVLDKLNTPIQALQKRSQRFHDLDEARLNEYYDGIERDLQKRMITALPDRRASLADKLETTTAERQTKLANVSERYQVRLNLTLLNLMVIVQPKLILPVSIESRAAKTKAYAVWDPLLHRLEPLICTVCGRPSQRTLLCHNGHLAHEDCLAPGCVDCKRVFCRQCSHEIGQCDVCHRPLCRHSRITCHECGRGACQAHKELCHANDGRPVDLATYQPEPEPESLPPPPPKPKPGPKPRTRKPAPAPKRVKPRRIRPTMPKGVPKPQRIEVVVFPDEVVAFVLASRERQIAMRSWQLDPEQGILITCRCEKGADCDEDEMVMRPLFPAQIEQQLSRQITELRQEYGLPPKKVSYNRAAGRDYVPIRRFILYGDWKDETALAQARNAF